MSRPMEQSDSPPQVRREKRSRMNVLRQLYVVFLVGAFLATLFTAWTPLGLFPSALAENIGALINSGDSSSQGGIASTTPRPRPLIGIVAGHWGNDSGAVCLDGLTEVEVNLNIATRVKENLVEAGFDVDLLQEFDEGLSGYRSIVLVSIHADTCQFIDDNASGFKVAAALASAYPEKTSRLVACIRNRYESSTNLRLHAGSTTRDMGSYHAFEEIDPETTSVIIETGFLNLDRQILTSQPELVAEGITDGILCYIFNEDASGAN